MAGHALASFFPLGSISLTTEDITYLSVFIFLIPASIALFSVVHFLRTAPSRTLEQDLVEEQLEKTNAYLEQSRNRMKNEEERMRTILNNVLEGIVTIDDKGEIQSFNKAAEHMFDYEAKEIIGRRVSLLMPPDQLGLREGILKRRIEDEPEIMGVEREFTGYRKDGTPFPMAVTVSKTEIGQEILYIGVIRDIKAQKEKEEDMRKIKERAESANRTKSEFLANMSHELRTPLNGIMGTTQLLLSSELTANQQELVSTVFLSSNNLLKIVNDILDLSKIEAGDMQMEAIGFDPHQIMTFVVHELAHAAREKKISIIRHYEYETIPYVIGDPLRFRRIVTNLLSNALKYTNKGRIEISAKPVPINDTHIELQCEVTDSGIGIPKEKLSSVFDKFVQADTSTTRKFGGTGLGLAITREIVLKMAGKIGVRSEVSKGSTFWFTIPFEITDKLHHEETAAPNKPSRGKVRPNEARVLIAEDQRVNQMLIKQLMNKFGIETYEIVSTGAEAVEAYQRAPWTVVLMDCYMPERNGYDATSDIRNLERTTSAHVPIVAMTANAMVGDKEKCLDAGMDDYISKPINIRIMQETLGQWIAFDEISGDQRNKRRFSPNAHPVDLIMLRLTTAADPTSEKEFVHTYTTDADEIIQRMKDCAANNDDLATWIESSTALMGKSGSLGAENMRDLCHNAKLYNGDSTGRLALIEKIEAEYTRVKEYLRGEGLLA